MVILFQFLVQFHLGSPNSHWLVSMNRGVFLSLRSASILKNFLMFPMTRTRISPSEVETTEGFAIGFCPVGYDSKTVMKRSLVLSAELTFRTLRRFATPPPVPSISCKKVCFVASSGFRRVTERLPRDPLAVK